MIFANLLALRTRMTVAMAPQLLSLTPRVAELMLDVVDVDPANGVVRVATVALQAGLCELRLRFWRSAVVDNGALDTRATLSQLREIRAAAAAVAVAVAPRGSAGRVDARRWRGFFASLPLLESVRLPPSVVVAAANLLRLVGRSCPYMQLNGAASVCDLAGTGGVGPLFPCLETLGVRSLQPEKKTRWAKPSLSRSVLSRENRDPYRLSIMFPLLFFWLLLTSLLSSIWSSKR
jgi:hypothetical protein